MGQQQDFICDQSGVAVSQAAKPVVVYLVAGEMAPVDRATLSPFLQRLLAMMGNGGRIELSAEVFDAAIGNHIDLSLLDKALPGG